MNFILWIFIGLSFLALWFWFVSEERAKTRLVSDMRTARENMSSELHAELEALLYQGRKMEAIKRLREETGVSLKAALSVIRRM